MNTQRDVNAYVPHDSGGGGADGALERWEIAPGSRLKFTLRHLVLQQIHGEFRRWGGTLFLSRDQPALSRIEAWVDLASIATDSVERDAHVRSAEFLDVERFPRARFESTAIEPHDGRVTLRGRLHLHGVAHDVDLEIEAPSLTSASSENTYSVIGRVDRQTFGLHWNQDLDVGGVVVGDEIDLAAEVSIVHLP
jgi:polyisoprenoid-binding protein YceI